MIGYHIESFEIFSLILCWDQYLLIKGLWAELNLIGNRQLCSIAVLIGFIIFFGLLIAIFIIILFAFCFFILWLIGNDVQFLSLLAF